MRVLRTSNGAWLSEEDVDRLLKEYGDITGEHPTPRLYHDLEMRERQLLEQKLALLVVEVKVGFPATQP